MNGEVQKSYRQTRITAVLATALSSIGDLASPSSNLRCVQSGRASPAWWRTLTHTHT